MATPEPLLVLGATGRQGKKLVDTIITSDSKASFTLLALTRNPESPSAKALAAKSSTIKLVKGNLDDVPACFKAALEATNGIPIWGVFSIQQALQDGATQEREMKQGKDMIDGAISNGVKVFVQTSVDRGGDKSDSNPTNVPHFVSKHYIEAYLRERAEGGNMTYTILRPTAFMEGLTPNFMGKMFATMFKVSLGSRPICFIATSDIGFFAGQAFMQPDSPDYKNQAISLAGDEITFEQINQNFKDKLGYPVPTTFEFLTHCALWMLPELRTMMRWFGEEGYVVDIPKLKRMHPGLMTFGDWLERESGFRVRE
ncbi:hypothetical protein N7G274_002885 [Stereocaulon virgatum]|uniref:NmrA-like domain-containing protein n=1 Tax=Stereocaulon virgatum TaxID=373712 RepID=A0ABR4AEG7_9LECA